MTVDCPPSNWMPAFRSRSRRRSLRVSRVVARRIIEKGGAMRPAKPTNYDRLEHAGQVKHHIGMRDGSKLTLTVSQLSKKWRRKSADKRKTCGTSLPNRSRHRGRSQDDQAARLSPRFH